MPYVTSIERIAKQEGIREGLLSGIEVALEIKFGNEGLKLLPEIAQIDDIEVLKSIQSGQRHANTIDELRAIYQPSS